MIVVGDVGPGSRQSVLLCSMASGYYPFLSLTLLEYCDTRGIVGSRRFATVAVFASDLLRLLNVIFSGGVEFIQRARRSIGDTRTTTTR